MSKSNMARVVLLLVFLSGCSASSDGACADGQHGTCEEREDFDDVAALMLHRTGHMHATHHTSKLNASGGPGEACNHEAADGPQYCQYYGCEVLCPADNICPTHLYCSPDQFCQCEQADGTKACPADGLCKGPDGGPSSLAQADKKVTHHAAKLNASGGPGEKCNHAAADGPQYCQYYGCEVLCPADNICPTHLYCSPDQFCQCEQADGTKACPADGLCKGPDGGPSSLAQADKKVIHHASKLNASGGPGEACNHAAADGPQYCQYYGCEVLCPADNVCPTQVGCSPGQSCPCTQEDGTFACPADGICKGDTGPN